MNQQDFPAPTEGFVVTHMLIVDDIDRSVDFYVGALGATELMRIPEGPAVLGFSNTWIIINVGGGSVGGDLKEQFDKFKKISNGDWGF